MFVIHFPHQMMLSAVVRWTKPWRRTSTNFGSERDKGIPAIESWLISTSDNSNIYPNACQATNVASSLYYHQMARSVDPKLSSAARKVAKQKLKSGSLSWTS